MSQRITDEWRARVQAEYRSAAITARVVHSMIQTGLPHELIGAGLDVVRDELHHAELSREALVAFGGADTLPTINAASLDISTRSEGILATLLDAVIRNFCLGETLAVPLFHAMYEGTRHPAARVVIEQVLRDEANHRAFGWTLMDALIEAHAGVIPWVTEQLPSHASAFKHAYAQSTATIGLTAEERAAGLIEPADYHRVFWAAWHDDIAPRFAKRGIRPPTLEPS